MGKASLVLIVLSHYLLILYAHVRYGRPKKEREGTYRKVTAILLKDWLLTPIIIASAIVYVFTGNEPIWRNVSVAVSGKAKIIGAVLIIVSMLLKFYAYKTLGRNWSPKLNIYPDHELVRVGPYKYLRHPVYVSYSLTFMGLALILGNFLCSIFGFIYQVLNLIRAKHEEGGLLEKFGQEYRQYLANTDVYRAMAVLMPIILISCLGMIDEVSWLVIGKMPFLELGYKLWVQLSG